MLEGVVMTAGEIIIIKTNNWYDEIMITNMDSNATTTEFVENNNP